jgi:hypothetical protein
MCNKKASSNGFVNDASSEPSGLDSTDELMGWKTWAVLTVVVPCIVGRSPNLKRCPPPPAPLRRFNLCQKKSINETRQAKAGAAF